MVLPSRLELLHGLAQLARSHGVEALGRLVEEEDGGVVQQGAGDMELLLHAGRGQRRDRRWG